MFEEYREREREQEARDKKVEVGIGTIVHSTSLAGVEREVPRSKKHEL